MTKEEALKKAKEHYWFLSEFPEWNNDKEVVLATIQQNGLALQFASNELRNNKELAMIAIQKNAWALEFVSDELKNDKEVVMAAVQQNGYPLQHASKELRNNKNFILEIIKIDTGIPCYSLLEEYQTFEDIVEKEGEEFLFSCWNNLNQHTRMKVAKHPNFLPTLRQIGIGLKDWYGEARDVYQLRQDEWIAKMEESELRKNI